MMRAVSEGSSGWLSRRTQAKAPLSGSYAPHLFFFLSLPSISRSQGYLRIPLRVLRVSISPGLSMVLTARFVTILNVCGLPSKLALVVSRKISSAT